jgi:NACHT N-terminal Helical domain 7/ATPase family associated with various cellular activities (AAA)
VPKTLSYIDAARLLGGDDELLDRLDALAGGVMLTVAPVAPAILALLDAKTQFARLGHDLVRRLRERRAGLGRYDRTQRLAAAHTVLVIAAYFETMAEADLPLRFTDLELTAAEQVAIAGQAAVAKADSFVGEILAAGSTLPTPHGAHEAYAHELASYYERLSQHVERFLTGLAVWDDLSASARDRFVDALGRLPERAVRRYGDHIRSLGADFPEVAAWVNMLEHEATRDAVRRLEPSLARLERELARVSSGRVPDKQARGLARAYRAALPRPIAESGDVPPDLAVPTLERAYIPPRYRVTDVVPQGGPSNEAWWEGVEVRDDLEGFLVHYLICTRATEAPILVLGQPGAGKSVLTRVLAARLPSADFLVVRVPLRDVAAESDIQGQIEQAIHQATGERLAWPALVRSCPGALPVVLIDGFDELLQATGVRQTDYLMRVADFQRRECDQARPVAVVVTTRTSVADQARTPADTLLLRLEPFDPPRIEAWVTVWNATNAANFERAGIRPLDIDAMKTQAEIAGQPLLLLMLALYDADGNALRRLASSLQRTELYEQLLVSFARREIVKHRPEITAEELGPAAEQEMRRLSIVAFAIFNRASQWVTETELDRDLTAIFGTPTAPSDAGMRSPMRSAELTLGRFFFVHRAQARRDEASLHTYEFLHATFGEYLVARLTWQVALDTTARDRAATLPTGGVDDKLMYALLSFEGLAARRPVVDFLVAMAADLADAPRHHLAHLLIRLGRTAGLPRAGRAFEDYQPRQLTVSARHAAYSANILLLAVVVQGSLRASDMFQAPDRNIAAWENQALLWYSQLGNSFHGMVDTLAIERIVDGDNRDLRITLDDGRTEPAPVDPLWTYEIERPGETLWRYLDELPLRRRVNFVARRFTDVMLHAIEPLIEHLGPSVLTFYSIFPERPELALIKARALIDAWLLSANEDPQANRDEIYRRCAVICARDDRAWSNEDELEQRKHAALLLSALSADRRASTQTASAVIETLVSAQWLIASLSAQVAECIMSFLLRDDASGTGHKRLVASLAHLDPELVEPGVLRVVRWRIRDLGLTPPSPEWIEAEAQAP